LNNGSQGSGEGTSDYLKVHDPEFWKANVKGKQIVKDAKNTGGDAKGKTLTDDQGPGKNGGKRGIDDEEVIELGEFDESCKVA